MLLLFSAQRELLLVVFEVFYFFHELSRNCSTYSARSMLLLYVSLVGPPPLLGFIYCIRVCVSILLSITVLLKNCDLIAVRIVVGSIRHS
jgi:hypothetical protein